MAIPYEQTGRRNQKARTRDALVAAARTLLADGLTPTVEEAAAAAAVSRTTAYRYFRNQHALIGAAHPEIDQASLLPPDGPDDPMARLDLVLQASGRIVVEWEPQLRASLRLSLEPGGDPTGPVLRRGRVIGWLLDALVPARRRSGRISTCGGWRSPSARRRASSPSSGWSTSLTCRATRHSGSCGRTVMPSFGRPSTRPARPPTGTNDGVLIRVALGARLPRR